MDTNPHHVKVSPRGLNTDSTSKRSPQMENMFVHFLRTASLGLCFGVSFGIRMYSQAVGTEDAFTEVLFARNTKLYKDSGF